MKVYFEGQLYTPHSKPVEAWLTQQFLNRGVSLFKELDGHFLLAIDHTEDSQFYLVRDAVGEHPVHFLESNPRVFSSTLLHFKEWVGVKVDPLGKKMALRQFKGQVESYYPSLLSEVKSLSPGHYLRLTGNKIDFVRYWDPYAKTVELSSPEALTSFQDLLTKAVKKRTSSQQKVAYVVSGGLDSSSLLAVACRNLKNTPLVISYFSKKYPEADETYYQKIITSYFKLTPLSFDVSDVLSKEINPETQIRESEGIFIDLLFQVTKKIWSLAKTNGCHDLIFGHWGDQVLGPPQAFIDPLQPLKLFKYLSSLESSSRWPFIKMLLSLFAQKHTKNDYYKDLLQSPYHLLCMEHNFKITRSNGVRQHYPFLDKHLLEFLIQIPSAALIQNAQWKSLLKESLKNILPKELLSRTDKSDFTRLLENNFESPRLARLWQDYDENAMRLWPVVFSKSFEKDPDCY